MSSDRTDFELYKVATMQGIAWQTDKQTDKQSINHACWALSLHFSGRLHHRITATPPLQTQHPTFRVGEKGRWNCFEVFCIDTKPLLSYPVRNRSIFRPPNQRSFSVPGSVCFFLHSFGFYSCSHDSPPVLPTLPRELAWALSQSDFTHQSVACPISPRASFL
jgi:hypothetical protein